MTTQQRDPKGRFCRKVEKADDPFNNIYVIGVVILLMCGAFFLGALTGKETGKTEGYASGLSSGIQQGIQQENARVVFEGNYTQIPQKYQMNFDLYRKNSDNTCWAKWADGRMNRGFCPEDFKVVCYKQTEC